MRKEKGNQKLNAFFPSLLKFEYMEEGQKIKCFSYFSLTIQNGQVKMDIGKNGSKGTEGVLCK